MLRVHLIRHGQVDNPDDVMYCRMPGFKLTEKGVKEADQVGRYLSNMLLRDEGKKVKAVYHSPMLRAKLTAEKLRESGNLDHLPLIEHDLLHEANLPYWEAKKRLDVMPLTQGRLYDHIPEEHLHENESRDDVMNRVVAFFEAMHKEYFVENDVVEVIGVSHGDPCCFAHVWAKHKITGTALEPDSHDKLGYTPSHCSVSTFEFTKKDVVEPSDSFFFSHTYSSASVLDKN